MTFAIKTVTRVQAWELGAGSDKEKEMIHCGKIVAHPNGVFELYTQEATEGKGQMAKAGDFFKIDNRGCPCPNDREFFLQNHQHIKDDWYRQIAKPLRIWRLGDPECEELIFLLKNGILSIHPEDKQHCYSASLWGTTETAAVDATIVFYSVERDQEGKINAVDFNFVDADFFRTHYQIITSSSIYPNSPPIPGRKLPSRTG